MHRPAACRVRAAERTLTLSVTLGQNLESVPVGMRSVNLLSTGLTTVLIPTKNQRPAIPYPVREVDGVMSISLHWLLQASRREDQELGLLEVGAATINRKEKRLISTVSRMSNTLKGGN